MKNQTLGMMISDLRKGKGMTQMELVNKMGVTDKAEIVNIVLKGVSLAMGITVVVLSILGEIDMKSAIMMLGIGITSFAMCLLKDSK